MGNRSPNIDNLYLLARIARDSSDKANALRYYEMLINFASEDWEPAFFAAYFRCSSSKTEKDCEFFAEALQGVFYSISKIGNESQLLDAVNLVTSYSASFAISVKDVAVMRYNDATAQTRAALKADYKRLGHKAAEIVMFLLDYLLLYFSEMPIVMNQYRPIYSDLCLFSDFITAEEKSHYRDKLK